MPTSHIAGRATRSGRAAGPPLSAGKYQRGISLVEAGLVMVVAGAIVSGALALGQSWYQQVQPYQEAARVETRADALRLAITSWYGAYYCTAGPETVTARDFPIPRVFPTPPVFPIQGMTVAAACGAAAGHCVERYLAPHLAHLLDGPAVPESPSGSEFDWELVAAPAPPDAHPPPLLRLYWYPTERHRGKAYLLARQMDAYCDSDGDAATAEPCRGLPEGGRLVWSEPFGGGAGWRASRQGRLREWLAGNAIECCSARDDDTGECLNPDRRPFPDGLPDMDAFCDRDRNGVLGSNRPDDVFDVDGDCEDFGNPDADKCYDESFLDRNGDGLLDLDITGDLAVNAIDFHALGC